MPKRTVALTLFWALLASFTATTTWAVRVTERFELAWPYWPELKRASMVALAAPSIRPITLDSLVIGALVAGVVVWFAWLFGNPHRNPRNYVRGATITTAAVLKRMADDNTTRNRLIRLKRSWAFSSNKLNLKNTLRILFRRVRQVTIAGVPFPVELEPVHLLIAGTTGSGKSHAIKELLSGVRARGDRLIICDPNGDYFSIFGCRDDIILNPFDARFPGWTIFNEIRDEYDCERYARSIVPDGNGENKEWNGYAQALLRELLLKLYKDGCRETGPLVYCACELPINDLANYLKETAVSGFFMGAPETIASTRFILTRYISSHKHLIDGPFALRDWLAAGRGNLYITWRQDMADALRPLITTWFDILITAVLSLPVGRTPRPTWFVCDELASMERLSSLEDGLTKGRKHGARFVCGIQSTSQLDDIYGKDKATTLRSCYRSVFYLNIPNTDPDTAEALSKGIGDTEILRKEISRSTSFQSGQRSVSRRLATERLIMPSQIHNLPNLAGYLCLAGDYPVALVRCRPRVYPGLNDAVRTRPGSQLSSKHVADQSPPTESADGFVLPDSHTPAPETNSASDPVDPSRTAAEDTFQSEISQTG